MPSNLTRIAMFSATLFVFLDGTVADACDFFRHRARQCPPAVLALPAAPCPGHQVPPPPRAPVLYTTWTCNIQTLRWEQDMDHADLASAQARGRVLAGMGMKEYRCGEACGGSPAYCICRYLWDPNHAFAPHPTTEKASSCPPQPCPSQRLLPRICERWGLRR